MQVVTMFKKGSKIVRVGFVPKLCGPDKAIAFEKTRKCVDHTEAITESSEHFATYVGGNIRAGAVGCNHLNQFIAAIFDGVKCPELFKDHLCEKGFDTLSRELITNGYPNFREAVDDGLRWTLIDADIEDEYPDCPDILQRALNVEHHIGEGFETN